MQHILKNELGIKPLKFQKVQELNDGQKKVRLERAKELLRLHASGLLTNLFFLSLDGCIELKMIRILNKRSLSL